MKKYIITFFWAILSSINIFAQIMEDDFETNQYGWTETASKHGTALIKEGVLHMESKDALLTSTTYGAFDISKPFVLTVEALAKKIENDKIFGILLDYEDDQNLILFYICEGEAYLEVWKEGKLTGLRHAQLKLKSGKNVGIDFEVEYNLNELVFKVNKVKAMTYRRRITNNDFLLGTSGIGFAARGGQIIDFDNLKIIQ